MLLRPGWIAKRGAEGLLCVATSDGRGYALVEDGSSTGVCPGLAAVLGIDELGPVDVPETASARSSWGSSTES